MEKQKQIELQTKIYSWFNSRESGIDDLYRLKTSDSLEGWANCVETHFVKTGKISQEDYNNYQDHIFREFEQQYLRKIREQEEVE